VIEQQLLLDELLNFLRRSPTPFHAVDNMITQLRQHGFVALAEHERWQLRAGGRYYVTRNDSSLIAFVLGNDNVIETGMHMAGAHTDSPCLKIKPNPEMQRHGCFQLGVEVYGGALLGPWFDRDLSLAGRVTYLAADGALANALIERETVEDVELAELFKDIDTWPGLQPEETKAPVEPPMTPPIPIPVHAAEPTTRPAPAPATSRWGRVWRRAPRTTGP